MMLSDDVSQAVDRVGLGPVEAVHSYSNVRVAFLVVDTAFVVPAFALLVTYVFKPLLFGGRPNPTVGGSALVFAVVAVPLTLGWWLARWPRHLVVACQDGFVDVRNGVVGEAIRWDDVNRLSLGGRGSPNKITYGAHDRTYVITRGGLRMAHRCARELAARGRAAPVVPPVWAVTCLFIGIFLPWMLIAPGLALNHRVPGGGLIVLIAGVPLLWGMAGLRRSVIGSGGLGRTRAERIGSIGCLAAAAALVVFLTLGLPTLVALRA